MNFLLRQWNKPIRNFSESTTKFSVSLLIPFRNEIHNLPAVFEKLNKLNYEELEIIWIDDHSEDDSVCVLKKLLDETPINHSMKLLKCEGIGKKAALTAGVESAGGEIIITTDADCQMSPNWVEQMTKPFQQKAIHLVAGPVMTVDNDSFFSKFQQADWASILMITQAGFANQMPLMCSGANLAYRKSTFNAVHGFEGNMELASGDDEFILKKIFKELGSDSVFYLQDKTSLVKTLPFKTKSELIRQRIRWASKWNAHNTLHHEFSAIIPLLVQLIFLFSISLMFFGYVGFLFFVLFWTMKIMIEKTILGKILEGYGIPIGILYWIGIGFLHPFYVIVTAIGAVKGKYVWKGRENQKRIKFGKIKTV